MSKILILWCDKKMNMQKDSRRTHDDCNKNSKKKDKPLRKIVSKSHKRGDVEKNSNKSRKWYTRKCDPRSLWWKL